MQKFFYNTELPDNAQIVSDPIQIITEGGLLKIVATGGFVVPSTKTLEIYLLFADTLEGEYVERIDLIKLNPETDFAVEEGTILYKMQIMTVANKFFKAVVVDDCDLTDGKITIEKL